MTNGHYFSLSGTENACQDAHFIDGNYSKIQTFLFSKFLTFFSKQLMHCLVASAPISGETFGSTFTFVVVGIFIEKAV